MNQTHYLLKGTFLLTAAGVLSRIAGFFYKIFLSRTIGAEEIGLFHLCMPLYTFCIAAASGGIQTALSRFTAEYEAKKEHRSAHRILVSALIISLLLALVCCLLLYQNAARIASVFLAEPRCEELLQIIAFSLPFCVTHACISGYYMGLKQVAVPAISQLIEQLLRIGSAFFFYCLFAKNSRSMDASVMALGQIAGELASSLFCTACIVLHLTSEPRSAFRLLRLNRTHVFEKLTVLVSGIRRVLAVSAPLSVNRMLLCVLQAIEAALLPQQLRFFGLTSQEALYVYGTLTGMTMPLLLFPTAVTGSVSTLLLPLISEANALNQENQISATTRRTFEGSLLLGLFFFSLFFLFGKQIGSLLFASPLSGAYLSALALLCPFLYINTTVISILHGIGKTTAASVQNTISFLLRLCSVIWLIPHYGISGYFFGSLLSQVFVTIFALITLYRAGSLRFSFCHTVLKPVFFCLLTVASILLLRAFIPFLETPGWPSLLIGIVLCSMIFCALMVCGYLPDAQKIR